MALNERDEMLENLGESAEVIPPPASSFESEPISEEQETEADASLGIANYKINKEEIDSTDPVEASEVLKGANNFKVSTEFYKENKDKFDSKEKEDRYKKFLLDSAPIRRLAKDKTTFSIIKDDIENLHNVEKKLDLIKKDKPDSWLTEVTKSLKNGYSNMEYATGTSDWLAGVVSDSDYADKYLRHQEEARRHQAGISKERKEFDAELGKEAGETGEAFEKFKDAFSKRENINIVDYLKGVGQEGINTTAELLDTFGTFFSNPEQASKLVAESAAFSVPGYVMGGLGAAGAGAIGGPLTAAGGFVVGVGLGSAKTETGSSFAGAIEERLGPGATKEQVIELLNDPVFVKEARRKALQRGAVSFGVSAASAGLAGSAGKVGAKVAATATKQGSRTAKVLKKVGSFVAETAREGVGESAEEFLMSYAENDGDLSKISAADILTEGLAAMFQGPVTAGIKNSLSTTKDFVTKKEDSNKSSLEGEVKVDSEMPIIEAEDESGSGEPVDYNEDQVKQTYKDVQEAAEVLGDAQDLEQIKEAVIQSKTFENSPEAFQQFYQEQSGEIESDTLFFDVTDFDKWFSDNESITGIEAIEKYFGEGFVEQYQEAKESNGQVKIPLFDYLKNTKELGNLSVVARLREDAPRLVDAANTLSVKGKELKSMVKNADKIKAKKELRTVDHVKSELSERIMKATRVNQAGKEVRMQINGREIKQSEADAYAEVQALFVAKNAQRLNITPAEFLQKYDLNFKAEAIAQSIEQSNKDKPGVVKKAAQKVKQFFQGKDKFTRTVEGWELKEGEDLQKFIPLPEQVSIIDMPLVREVKDSLKDITIDSIKKNKLALNLEAVENKHTGKILEIDATSIQKEIKRSFDLSKVTKKRNKSNSKKLLRMQISAINNMPLIMREAAFLFKKGEKTSVFSAPLRIGNESTVVKFEVTRENGKNIVSKFEVSPKRKNQDQAASATTPQEGLLQGSENPGGVLSPSSISISEFQKQFNGVRQRNFFQDGDAVAKGEIVIGQENEAVISLFKNADHSTMIHETGHWFFETMRDMAFDENSPQEIRDDYYKFADYLGAAENPYDLTVEQSEKAARAFEVYVMEGKAPSAELVGFFNKFRSYLLGIYKKITNLGADINDDIRDIFDRMLVVDEVVNNEYEETGGSSVFQDLTQIGITQEAQEGYEQILAKYNDLGEVTPVSYEKLQEKEKALADSFIGSEISGMVDEIKNATQGERKGIQQKNEKDGAGYTENINLSQKSTFPGWYSDAKVKNKDHFLKAVESEKGPIYARIKKIAINNLMNGVSSSQRQLMPNNEFRLVLKEKPLAPTPVDNIDYEFLKKKVMDTYKQKITEKVFSDRDYRDLKEYRQKVKEERVNATDLLNTVEFYQDVTKLERAIGLQGKDLDLTRREISDIMYKNLGTKLARLLLKHDVLTVLGEADVIFMAESVLGGDLETISKLMEDASKFEILRNNIAENKVKNFYNDLMEEGSEFSPYERVKQLAKDAQHNTKRSTLLRKEFDLLMAKAPKTVRDLIKRQGISLPSNKEIKDIALKEVNKTPIGKLTPTTYYRKNKAIFRQITDALSRGDFKKVIELKRQELINNEIYMMAREKQQKVIKYQKRFKDYSAKSDTKLAATRDLDLVYGNRALLSYFGLGRVTEKSIQSIQKYMKKLASYNPDGFASMSVLLESLGDLRASKSDDFKYSELSASEFDLIADTFEAIDTLAKDAHTITINNEKVDRGNAVRGLTKALSDIPAKERKENTVALSRWERFIRGVKQSQANKIRISSVAQIWDKGISNGPFNTYIVRPLREAMERKKLADTNQLVELNKIFEGKNYGVDSVKNRVRDFLNQKSVEKTIIAKELLDETGKPLKLSKSELIVMLLNMGTESNIKKMLIGNKLGTLIEEKGKPQSQWKVDSTNFDAFFERMQEEGFITQEDIELAQNVWKFLEKDLAAEQKVYKKIHGQYMEEVEPRDIKTKWGTIKGGYFPLMVNKELAKQSLAQKSDAEKYKAANPHIPTAKSLQDEGFTNSRVSGVYYPLTFELNLLPRHVRERNRMIHVQGVAIEVSKLTEDQDFRDAAEKLNPFFIESVIKPAISRVYYGVQTGVDRSDSVTRKIFSRAHSSASKQFFFGNLKNTAEMVASSVTALTHVKASSIVKATASYISGFKGDRNSTSEFIYSKSNYMQNEFDSLGRDMARKANHLGEKKVGYSKVKEMINEKLPAFFTQQFLAEQLGTVVWIAAYQEGLESGMTDSDSVYKADQAVQETQGLSDDLNRSLMEEKLYLQMMVPFMAFFNSLGNQGYAEIGKAIRKNDTKLGLSLDVSRVYMKTIFPVALFSTLALVVFGRGVEDEDDDGIMDDYAQELINQNVSIMAAMLPLIGGSLRAYFAFTTDRPVYESRASFSPPAFSIPLKAAKSMTNLIKDEKELNAGEIRNLWYGLGMATDTPIGVLGKAHSYQKLKDDGKIKKPGVLRDIKGYTSGN